MRKSLSWVVTILLLSAIPSLAGWDEGVAAFQSKDYAKAIQEFQTVVDQSPDFYQGYYMLGQALNKAGRKEEALKNLKKAYSIQPNDLGLQMVLGSTYSDLRRYSDAIGVLKKVDDSKLPEKQKIALYTMRAKANSRMNNEAGAMKEIGALLRLKPNDADLQYQYGGLALSQGNVSQAIAAFAKAHKLAPGDAEKGRKYVSTLIRQGRMTRDKAAKKQAYTKAAGVAKSIASAKPTHDNLLLQLEAELGAGMYGEATRTGERTVAKKSDWLSNYYLGQAYTSAGRFDDAIAPLEISLAKASGSDRSTVLKQLGFVYEKQKNFAKSIDFYEQAGDAGSVARVRANQETAQYNEKVEGDNAEIERLKAEAEKLEAEMKAMEGGGGF